MRRACSSGVRSVSLASSSDSPSVYSGVRVRGRDERSRPRPSAGRARRSPRRAPTRSRISDDETGIGSISNWTMRSRLRVRSSNRAGRRPRGNARAAWRRRVARAPATRSGDFQSRKSRELVGAEDEDRRPSAALLERRRPCERGGRARPRLRGRPRTRVARARAASRPEVVARLCPGSATTRTRSSLEPELSDRRTSAAPRGRSAADRTTPPRMPSLATRAPPRRPRPACHA